MARSTKRSVPFTVAARVLLVLALPLVSSKSQAQFALADFNGEGFDWTFDNFTAVTGPDSVRLTDLSDGWGGAGVVVPGGGLDLSGYSDGYFQVDLTREPLNGVSQFTLELIDQVGPGGSTERSGKWTFDVSSLTPGVPSTVTASTPLSSPGSGIGDFTNLDLSAVQRWQILGDFGSPEPFDLSFDSIVVTGDAPPPYPGHEADAPWRAEAASRIEANRKADVTVTVLDAAGNPLPGARIEVRQLQHEFGFGSAVQAFRLRDNNPQHNQYKVKVAELFNVATLENNLKWPPWEGEWGSTFTQSGAVNALDWLAGEGIDGRGHVMVWPGYNNLPADIKAMLDDSSLSPTEQNAVRNRIAQHITNVAAATNGKVVAWDVINETRTNNDLMDELSEGDQAMVNWFQLARNAAPGTALYINDFGILSSAGGVATSNQNHYYNTINFLKNQNAQIDGIGFQGHFRESDLTGPEQLWTILDRFDEFGLEMQITEFDFETTDEQLQADFTRDFLTAMFAHEGVGDVIHWGFWENAHWRPEAAMYRSDWSLKPNGQAYLDLVFGEWWTDEAAEANFSGQADLRVFKGDYEITALHRGVSLSELTTLTDDGGEVVIVLPVLAGDFNGDGTVDTADFTVWRDNFGVSGPPYLPGDADGDGLVTVSDYGIWRSSFGQALPPAAEPAVAPEPAAALLLWMTFPALLGGSLRDRGIEA